MTEKKHLSDDAGTYLRRQDRDPADGNSYIHVGLLSGIDNELVGSIRGLEVRYCMIQVRMLEYDMTGMYTYKDMYGCLVMMHWQQ